MSRSAARILIQIKAARLWCGYRDIEGLPYKLERLLMYQILRTVTQWVWPDSEEGVTAIEYGLIAALIAVVIIAGLQLVGTNLLAVFNDIAVKITGK